MKSLYVLCALTATAHAYRPFDGTDADTAGEGDLELEVGPLIGERDAGQLRYEPGFVFNYGFAASWELVIDVDRFDDFVGSDVLVKHVLRAGSLQEAHGPSIAIETGPLLPGTSEQQREVGWVGNLIVSQRWDALTVHVNGGFMYGRDRDWIATANLIVEGPDTWRVRPVAEFAVEDRTTGLVGAIWRVTSTIALDAAVFAGQEDQGVRAGFTWVLAI